MATFPTTFEKDQSPLSPMSAASASNNPISYKANVNRNKTKKWADAKPVDYGGDDWGDDDDDEYEPPPPSKPTGLRQPGQGLQSGSASASMLIDNKKNYGELPPLPGAVAAPNLGRNRANSFDADDEKRNFSNAAVQQSLISTETTPTPPPATSFSPITSAPNARDGSGPPALSLTTQQLPQHDGSTGPRKMSQATSPISGLPHPEILVPGARQTNTSVSSATFSGPSRINTGESGSVYSQPSEVRTASSNFQARRDFSPTAVPAPLSTTRASPPPLNTADAPSSRFPARKSSLSQLSGPDLSQNSTPIQDSAAPKPWVGGRSSSPAGSARSTTTPSAKALPFIRPADIYRRVEEERERERQSIDSSRPSMDSLVGAKLSDRSDSPAKPPLRDKTSSESLGGSRQKAGIEREDFSTSVRYLQPSLEPVRERKSEYGFEGFRMNEHATKIPEDAESQAPNKPIQLEIEHARSSSVSPKLPDLNRISSFGIDLFAQPKSDELKPPLPRESDPIPAPSNTTSAQSEDTALRRRQSIGYTSVVNQAFDRKDDSSVPPTPASQTGSGVKRSDSESTGTDGISPIMSRAPSGAVYDARGRDGTHPSILEVVHEPVSPVTMEENSIKASDHDMPAGMGPGHRRDIRPPSPGNSPARTPGLAKSQLVSQEHEAVLVVDPSSANAASPVDYGEVLQPPRPTAEREGSFRPSLPGGWTSYASTSRSDTSQQDSTRASEEVERARTTTSHISSAHEQHYDRDQDGTLTASRRSSPRSTFDAAAGADLVAAAGAGLDQDSAKDMPMLQNPTTSRVENALPTYNLTLALSANELMSAPLDSRLPPKVQKISPEAQLRPIVAQTGPATDYSDVPIPPVEGTPVLEDVEYFPKPIVPSKQRAVDNMESDQKISPAMRPQLLPTLSNETRPQDDESDKLSKEIIKSLSPKPLDAIPRNDSLKPDQPNEQAATNDGRYSYLPSEYDNYWATTSEDAQPASLAASSGGKKFQKNDQSELSMPSPVAIVTDVTTSGVNTPPIPPISTRRTNVPSEPLPQPSMPQRFSWENSAEDVSLVRSGEKVPEVPTIPPHQAPHLDFHQDRTSEAPTKALNEALPREPSDPPLQGPYSQQGTMDYEKELAAQGLTSPVSEPADDEHADRDALPVGGPTLGGIPGAVQSRSAQSPQYESRLSLAEEKGLCVSSYPVSPTPPEDEHPSRSPEAYFSGPSVEQPADSAKRSSVSPVNSPVNTQFTPATRILAFKEIVAIKNPHQRIQTFDEMRNRFANMDSGLSDWMANLQAQHPEHANANGSWSGNTSGAPNGSARSKHSKAIGAQLPLQQPYYQQYLNASPNNPGTPVSRPGPSTPVGSQQGLSPAGGKKTSQQVQAKGKELLHTAGIFGGKAGKAGKGLLAKGKNKLRGSGAGDKNSPNLSPPDKPKNERRTSWGLPVAIAKSSGPPDEPYESSYSIKMPTSTPTHQERGLVNSQRGLSALEIPSSASGNPVRLSSVAINPPESQPPQSIDSAHPGGLDAKQRRSEQLQASDHVGIPAPITKTQPSWDPSNAIPTAEEEGFQYEDRSKQQPQALHSATPQKTLTTSESSHSNDAPFNNASEEPSDLNDWVMVSSEPEVKQMLSKDSTETPFPESYQPPQGPPPGFLERQRAADPQKAKTEDQVSTTLVLDQSQAQQRPEPNLTVASETYQPPRRSRPGLSKQQQTQLLVGPCISTTETQPSATVGDQPKTEINLSSEEPALAEAADDELHQQRMQEKSHPEVPRRSQVPLASVLDRPRFSYEDHAQSQAPQPKNGPQNPSHYSPTKQNFISASSEQQYQQGDSQEPVRSTSFKGLPPIRRTSTFGLGFGRKSKPRFPIDDEEDPSSPHSQHEATARNYAVEIGGAAGAATVAAYANQSEHKEPPNNRIHHIGPSSIAQQRRDSLDQTENPELCEAHPSGSQLTTEPQAGPKSEFQVPRAAVIPPEGLRRSQDVSRPNTASSPIRTSPIKSAIIPPQRLSLEQQRSIEGQRSRGFSESSQSTTRPDVQYADRGPRLQAPPLRPVLYDQPPSSAQRYPELFQTQQQILSDLGRDGELPAHMYQAPIPREAAFLPRQQTNEYQLPGVGPPTEERRPDRSKRSSGSFLREIGGRISRGTSRERGNSISQDVNMSPAGSAINSRGYDYPESSVASDEAQEKQKRRSSFFGNLTRASTTGLGPPQSRESVVAHFPGSRTDLLATSQRSPIGPSDRKRSFFGNASSSSPKAKSNKLSRSSTSGLSDEPGKKNRFSNLTNMFSRTSNQSSSPPSVQERPQATRELSYNERQPLESPQLDYHSAARRLDDQNKTIREPSQPRQFLSKKSTSGDPPKPRPDSTSRRPSASNLLNGIIGRRMNQKDRGQEDSSSQGMRSQSSQPMSSQQMSLGQTYTDLQQESSAAPPGQPSRVLQTQSAGHQDWPSQPQAQTHERGRRASREPQRETPRQAPLEPQYDSVPIPGGYSLVRGQGAMTAHTDYDPRGLSLVQQGQQFDPRYMQQPQQPLYESSNFSRGLGNFYEQPASLYPQTESRRTSQGKKTPTLSAVETYESYTKRSSPRLSHEDLLARSPAKEQPGQQRPYQLSLPEDEQDRDNRPMSLSRTPPVLSSPISTRSPQNHSMDQPQIKKQHDTIQRVQQPALRHPESPAGYPLPDDAVFSPVNEAARDMPPPPPPKWPHLDTYHGHSPNQNTYSQLLNIKSELDRSNTRLTAVSAVSGMSGPQGVGLNVPRKEGDRGREGITPSPTPPSPAYTPEREASPPRYSMDDKALEAGLENRPQDRRRTLSSNQNLRITTLERGTSPDLYNASPRLPPPKPWIVATDDRSNGNGDASASNRRAVPPVQGPSSVVQTSGMENATALAKAKSRSENTQSETQSGRRTNPPHEEKIYYDAETGEEGQYEGDEGDGVTMSATSYPGQEWNPYIGAGGFEDGYD